MLLWFDFIISVFYLFKVKKKQEHKNNTLQQCNDFKLLCYFKLTKLKEVRLLVIRWSDLTYSK